MIDRVARDSSGRVYPQAGLRCAQGFCRPGIGDGSPAPEPFLGDTVYASLENDTVAIVDTRLWAATGESAAG